jgi:hypothetical protein
MDWLVQAEDDAMTEQQVIVLGTGNLHAPAWIIVTVLASNRGTLKFKDSATCVVRLCARNLEKIYSKPAILLYQKSRPYWIGSPTRLDRISSSIEQMPGRHEEKSQQ